MTFSTKNDGQASERHSRMLGRQSRQDATYIGGEVPKNDGTTVCKLHVERVPVDAFWSVTIYDAAGYFERTPTKPIRPTTDPDGAITIQFRDCDGRIPNCLPTMRGNYTVRAHRTQ
jgi:hypothetical protein